MTTDNAWREPTTPTTTAIGRIVPPHHDACEQTGGAAMANDQTPDAAMASFDALAMPVIHSNRSGIVTGWNRAAEALFGYSAREAIGRWLPTIPPEEEERYALFRQRALIGETITNVAVEQIHKEGHRVSVLLSAAPWHADGEIVGVATTLTDLSTQRAREWKLVALAAAEARRARDAAYIATVADACAATDDERAILDALAGCTAGWSDSAGVVTMGEERGELVAYASRAADADMPVAALFEACAMGWSWVTGQETALPTAPRVYRLREAVVGGSTTARRYHTLAAA